SAHRDRQLEPGELGLRADQRHVTVPALPGPSPSADGPGSANGQAAENRLDDALRARQVRRGAGSVITRSRQTILLSRIYLLWCVAAVLALAAGCGDHGTASAPGATVVGEERTFVDASRPTPANGSYPGAGERTLATRLWYLERPVRSLAACGADGGPCALVVLAHGFGGSTARFDAFGRALAAAGYVVAAPAFPLTNDQAPGGHTTAIG